MHHTVASFTTYVAIDILLSVWGQSVRPRSSKFSAVLEIWIEELPMNDDWPCLPFLRWRFDIGSIPYYERLLY
ncbi:hypothetical protein Pdw03_6722 [Penicillium digitatum]|uniref:Uncharacterized protein n=1 Tax=Penicillium digitatum TaxID=36651 RepID=A0A7T6XKJ1_PENDI|nr:hypothetical protein Pdw03_6722 [Penicillium digitatum]